MPSMTESSGRSGAADPEITEMITSIEFYLQQTREVLDRIEGHIAELKKENALHEEKTQAKEDPMNKFFTAPTM